MKGHDLGYFEKSFSFSADISVGIPDSGFSFQIGRTGSSFEEVVSFSGHSGYIFDGSGNLMGGYQKDQIFRISGTMFLTGGENSEFTGRYSYFFNDLLGATNMGGGTGYVDTVLFEDYGDMNTAFVRISEEGGNPVLLADNSGVFLQGSDGFFLETL